MAGELTVQVSSIAAVASQSAVDLAGLNMTMTAASNSPNAGPHYGRADARSCRPDRSNRVAELRAGQSPLAHVLLDRAHRLCKAIGYVAER